MGKNKGFLEFSKIYPAYQPVQERVTHYREFTNNPDLKKIQTECGRCMDCGIPYCHALGCPLGTLIPEINENIWNGDYHEAYLRLESTGNFPEITGRLCPALCEASCSLSVNDYSVSVKCIEYSLAEAAFKNGWVKPLPPASENGIKAAVIGSGPAGLAAAQQLRRAGFSVTVFEKDKKPGGLLRYGIPSFKLEKWVLDRRLEQLEEEGVVFRNEVVIGDDISAEYLRRFYNIIVLASGAGKPREIRAIGSGYENIVYALDYLSSSERFLSGESAGEGAAGQKRINAEGKNVIVIGGGDTGADCVGTAVRQGAKQICQFEIMMEPETHIGAGNPSWPDYPRIMRNSTSHEEGGRRYWATEVYQFTGKDVYVEKAYCRKVSWNYDPVSGRYSYSPVAGSEFEVDADLVIIAAGFIHTEHSRLLSKLGVTFDRAGNIKKDENNMTEVEGIYAAGDCSAGASLIVKAIKSGRDAASSIIAKYKDLSGHEVSDNNHYL